MKTAVALAAALTLAGCTGLQRVENEINAVERHAIQGEVNLLAEEVHLGVDALIRLRDGAIKELDKLEGKLAPATAQ